MLCPLGGLHLYGHKRLNGRAPTRRDFKEGHDIDRSGKGWVGPKMG